MRVELRGHWRVAGTGVAALVLWTLASQPTGLPVHQIALFVAPAAIIGLAASWASYAHAPDRFRWRTGAVGAALGGALLTPLLAFLIALDGQARPHGLVAGFVRSAWLAFAVGLAVAVARAARTRSEQRGEEAGGPLEQALAPRPHPEPLRGDLPGAVQVVEERGIEDRREG